VRPIRPEDEPAHHEFIARLTPEDIRFRFFGFVRRLEHTQMARLTQIDYDREMALVATIQGKNGKEIQIGVARYVTNPDGESVEFALAIADDWQKHGVGRKLMSALIEIARQKGFRAVVGDVLAMNTKMFRLMSTLGFTIHPHPDDPSVKRVICSLHT
ncbi:MAG: GNAT family N-acetyltransferase, partial [Betaproteobacteria bacterium]